MKTKPPFLFYINNNSFNSKPKSTKNYENNINLIITRIPKDEIRNNPELEKLIHPGPKITYDIINNNKKSNIIKKEDNMAISQEIKISNLNSLKKMIYNYKQEGDELMENLLEIKEENQIFSKNYKNIQENKNEFKTGAYLDYDYLVNLASKYSSRGL